jgi:hypothetical protein
MGESQDSFIAKKALSVFLMLVINEDRDGFLKNQPARLIGIIDCLKET